MCFGVIRPYLHFVATDSDPRGRLFSFILSRKIRKCIVKLLVKIETKPDFQFCHVVTRFLEC